VGDGLKIRMKEPGERITKSIFQWMDAQLLRNQPLLFHPDGMIVKAVLTVTLTCVGSAHDMMLARFGNVFEVLQTIYERTQGVRSANQSTYAKTPLKFRFIMKPLHIDRAPNGVCEQFKEPFTD
jgi:hypothetical protein